MSKLLGSSALPHFGGACVKQTWPIRRIERRSWRKRAHWQIVPGLTKICRVIGVACVTPLIVHVNVPALPFSKASSAVPTLVAMT